MPELRRCHYVLTGPMGAGKTTLIGALESRFGWRTGREIAKDIIDSELEAGGTLIPWLNRHEFECELLRQRIHEIEKIPAEDLTFFDRGIPDSVAFYRSDGLAVPDEIVAASRNVRYNETVFYLPAWKEIYENRASRPQPFEDAIEVGELIQEAYLEVGYRLVRVPKLKPFERANFIRRMVANHVS